MLRQLTVPLLVAGDQLAKGIVVAELISQTENSRVYRAVDAKSGRSVAVKMPLMSTQVDAEAEARFLRELSVAKRLRHGSIVETLSAGKADAGPYLLMEFMWGGALSERLGTSRSRVSRRQAFEWLFDVTDAMVYFHERGVVHRDLKPSNLFFASRTEDAGVKVGDFGLAYERGFSRLTREGVALGTPAYMSPEQVKGEVPTPAADIYALGGIAHRVLNGRAPFVGSAREVMAQHLSVPPAKLRTYYGASQLSPKLIELVDAMLAKAPEDRPSTLEVRAGLGAFE